MARYVRAGGPWNWSNAGAWEATAGGGESVAVPTASDDVFMPNGCGNCTVDVATDSKSLTQSAGCGVLTNSGFRLQSRGNITLVAGKYVSSVDASRIVFFNETAISPTLVTGGNALHNLTATLQTAGVLTFGDNATFAASRLCNIRIDSGSLNLNGKTLSGADAVNRLLIYSNTIGTARTVTTSTAGSGFANCAFQDIAFANGGSNLDLSAITGLSSDCGGNSMSGGGTLTFTTPRLCTWRGPTGGNWGDVANWQTTGAADRVPLAQDTARFGAMNAGQTITVDVPRLCDFSGASATNTPALAMTTTGLTYTSYGPVNLTGFGTFTRNLAWTFGGRADSSITTNGKSLATGTLTIAKPGYTMTFSDALTTGGALALTNGGISSAYNVTATTFASSTGTTLTRTGTPTWTLTGSGAVWAAAGTVTIGTATIDLTYTGATATTFAGGTNAYNAITIAPGSGVLTFSGAFSYASMSISAPGGKLINWTHSTTYTQTGSTFLSGTADGAAIISPTLLNGGFETAGGGGVDVFANWEETPSGTCTINAESGANKYAGNYSCRMDIDALNSGCRIDQAATIGTVYKYSLWAKVNNATGGPTIFVGSSANRDTLTLTTSWVQYTGYFVADAATFRISRAVATSKSIYIDDVQLQVCKSIVLASTQAGTPFTLAKTSGIVECDYLSLNDSAAGGGAIWLAGNNSTNVSGNSGWRFNGSASGAASVTIAATGTGRANAKAAGAAALSISATGTARALARPTGAVALSVAAIGSPHALARATGSTSVAVSVVGTPYAAAQAIGSVSLELSATGLARAPASASGYAAIDVVAGPCYAAITVWSPDGFLPASKRGIGTYFIAPPRR